MRVVNNGSAVPANGRPLFVALGNFDGVHLGHRRIINILVQEAGLRGGAGAVLLFDPHPQAVLTAAPPPLLSSLEQRVRILDELGVDYVIIEPFTMQTAALTAGEFVREYLVKRLGIQGVVVGFDYNFGCGGRGKATDLKKLGREYGFWVRVCPPVVYQGQVVSSSLIRGLLEQGQVEEAAHFLGCYYQVRGEVVKGEGRGKTLGFPTANIDLLPGTIVPGNGVYLTAASIGGSAPHNSLTNIGCQPTFEGRRRTVEVYILDLAGDLYGRELKLLFLQKIRDEVKFNSRQSLINQIEDDVRRAREQYAQYPRSGLRLR